MPNGHKHDKDEESQIFDAGQTQTRPVFNAEEMPPIPVDVQLTHIPEKIGFSINPGRHIQDKTPRVFINTEELEHLQDEVETSHTAELLQMQTLFIPKPKLNRSVEQLTQVFPFRKKFVWQIHLTN